MKIKEFFENKDKIAIHCDTKEKAIKLLNEFHKLGYKWHNGRSYKDKDYNYWSLHKEDTCYDNTFNFCSKFFYESNKYKILEFEDIEFEDNNKEYIKSTMGENEKAKSVSWEEYDKIYQENQELKEIIIQLCKEKHHIKEMIKMLDKEEE